MKCEFDAGACSQQAVGFGRAGRYRMAGCVQHLDISSVFAGYVAGLTPEDVWLYPKDHAESVPTRVRYYYSRVREDDEPDTLFVDDIDGLTFSTRQNALRWSRSY